MLYGSSRLLWIAQHAQQHQVENSVQKPMIRGTLECVGTACVSNTPPSMHWLRVATKAGGGMRNSITAAAGMCEQVCTCLILASWSMHADEGMQACRNGDDCLGQRLHKCGPRFAAAVVHHQHQIMCITSIKQCAFCTVSSSGFQAPRNLLITRRAQVAPRCRSNHCRSQNVIAKAQEL